MSFEVLPSELLLNIFSYLNLDSWKTLSLVNQRWNQVIGQLVTIKISDKCCGNKYNEDACIPLEVLCGSSREYSKFSCSMHFMRFRMMTGSFGAVLKYCHQRWNMNTLHIKSRYGAFILFLKQHKNLLNDVVRADISVYDYGSTGKCVKRYNGGVSNSFDLSMEKLQRLNLDYKVSLFCSLSLHAPMLETLKVDRCVKETKIHLTFHDSTKLRSVLIRGNDSSSSNADPIELRSILQQAPKSTRLEISKCSIATTLSAMFGNLQTIILRCVTITPTDDPLECLNLMKLELRVVALQKPLKLRVPQLQTLLCDIKALQSLHLQDAFKADRIVLDLTRETPVYNKTVTTFPVGLSSFRRLHLVLGLSGRYDDMSKSWLWPYLSGITELKLQSVFEFRYVHRATSILQCFPQHFPQLNSLCLLKMEGVPKDFKFLPANVQNVSIEDCSTKASSITFPPTVECVRVKMLRTQMAPYSSEEVILLPPNRYTPLECQMEKRFMVQVLLN